jgi:hypothetical protein
MHECSDLISGIAEIGRNAMRSLVLLSTSCISLAMFLDASILAREAASMRDNVAESYYKSAIVLFGDDSKENERMPLHEIAVIPKEEMESLWSDLGIDTSDWSPIDPYGEGKTDFPEIYAAQGYIAFEREYRADELDELIGECQRASEIVNDDIAKRTLKTILEAAVLERNHQGRLSFRAGML